MLEEEDLYCHGDSYLSEMKLWIMYDYPGKGQGEYKDRNSEELFSIRNTRPKFLK